MGSRGNVVIIYGSNDNECHGIDSDTKCIRQIGITGWAVTLSNDISAALEMGLQVPRYKVSYAKSYSFESVDVLS